jgi:GNAT superfamily N-acetyltransferase
MPFAAVSGVRRGTLADVAGVARLSVPANREAELEITPPPGVSELSAPDLALRLLEDLDDGHALYVAEREGRLVGFAQISGLMVGDGGHLVELRRLYVIPDQRRRGVGRELLRLVLRDLRQRPAPPALRAWAGCGSQAARFMECVRGAPVRQRWKVGAEGVAVRGTVFGWNAVGAPARRAQVM